MTLRKCFVLGAILAAALSATTVLARENHALLIGASTYPNLDEKYWLKGPANDIDLVARYLTEASPTPFARDNVLVLADGVGAAQAPTLAAIRQAFADLTERVAAGDFVYLHFSGHGSQAPAADPDSELDGLDELFLPVDIGPWNDTTSTVENALVDDEIGAMIAALQARGAMVWAVFDSCHSGTVTRGAPSGDDEVRLRKLEPGALGIPQAALDAAETATRALPGSQPDPRARPQSPVDGAGAGGFVAFFAAQTNETTPEKRMPKGDPARRSQGVFTFVMFETLAQNPGITYRQLGQEILRRYSVLNLAQSTPMFEGDLDTVVFSGEPVAPVSQWPVAVVDEVINLPAGTLHGLGTGSELVLMASASDADDKALGLFRVDSADAFTSTVTAVATASVPAIATADLPRGAYLRRVGADLSFTLTIALPEDTGDSAAAAALSTALERLMADTDAAGRLQFVPAGAEADIRLAVLPDSSRPDAVWLLPGSGLLEAEGSGRTPSIGLTDKDTDTLSEILLDSFTRISRTLNLLRIGAGYGAGGLDVDVALLTKNKQDKTLRALDTVSVPRLIPNDEVHVEATNNTDQPVDINVLYVGADYSISHFYAGRMQPGDTLKKGLFRITDQNFGRDRVILVLTPAKPQSIVENLAFMQQDEMPTTRGSGMSGLANAFADAGFGVTTRAAVALSDDDDAGPGGQVLQFELDSVPVGN